MFLQQVAQAIVAVRDIFALAHEPEDFAILVGRRIRHLDLVPDPTQKGVVHQLLGIEIG